MPWIKAFISGFLATMVFHQGLFGLFYLAGRVPSPPFDLTPVPPLGVPAVVSLAFFGGLWGIALWGLVGRMVTPAFWSLMIILGAIAPTIVAMLVVFPLKGMEVTTQSWIGGLMLNASWAMGVAVFQTLLGARRSRLQEGRPR